ncbi:restriction endonuclease subunit S [Acinetobacter pittii]|uniref:restriction endonuclease subunit S n=1 Tax=Acinetobacter pittii TaxID=48296 RepID=UPI002A006F15|nr:restriction endonuclease subunit S [Acinetobacter pittii]MDX8163718.1 restriction endonuclease subunit S [Acinetobacter pittii]
MQNNEYREVYLGELLEGTIRNGYSPLPADKQTGYWVLGLGALGDDGIRINEVKPVTPEESVLQNILNTDDFLVSRSNTPDKVGRSIRFQGEIENCSFPDLMMRFRIDKNKADICYIEQILKSFNVRNYFKTCAAGSSSTMVKINKGILEKTPIFLPSLNHQKKISEILSTWDQAISITAKLLKNSQQQKKALAQQLLTGKKRLLDENGLRFGEQWKQARVADLLRVRKEKQIPTVDVPLFSLTIEDGITPKSDRYNREFLVKNTDEKKYKVVKPKDIVYNPANLRWGAINFSRLNHSVVVSPIYEVLYVSEKEKISLEFIAQKLMTIDQINRFASMVEGTLVERMAVKIEPFLATKLSIPSSLKEQEKIAEVLEVADQEIENLQKKLDCLKREKKALMQQLLTGKKRVKVAA